MNLNFLPLTLEDNQAGRNRNKRMREAMWPWWPAAPAWRRLSPCWSLQFFSAWNHCTSTSLQRKTYTTVSKMLWATYSAAPFSMFVFVFLHKLMCFLFWLIFWFCCFFKLNSWPLKVQTKFSFTIYPITFPSENGKEWKKLFKPCASQRLFLPVGLQSSSHGCNIFKWLLWKCVFLWLVFQLILREVDSLLYVDTDIIFLQPVEEIWALFSRFNSSHLAAMAPEHEEPRIGWYNRFARHPYYGKTGINSGVMLMNLTRLREKLFKVFFFLSYLFKVKTASLAVIAIFQKSILTFDSFSQFTINVSWNIHVLIYNRPK